ncbi:putative bifunctional diguanylate cyclase/phosphodiesterase [Agrobacterium larrymoorei]|uniref:Diguanylate cyclase (GGDEF)-like protein n=1 Tax=Agrobacterium larrymoorei TaxID=160699 RepID=A0ABU0UHB5_9HYPH|nr:EAL domain-containing protein [Agrobacterium larrymoorei]MDQ1184322.1 diguanylate cyclase (GGDEF)-like protein [Agrobacterium larrymoorei]
MTELALRDATLTDQLFAVRKTVAISIPVNMLLGLASLLVAIHSDKTITALVWFAISSIINLSRLLLCRLPVRQRSVHANSAVLGLSYPGVSSHLQIHTFLALSSGLVWGFVPILCDWYTSSDTLFYLTVVCGITAGAVTHGFAYAPIPMCFITPALLSVIVCLVIAGGFDRYVLAATVLLYLAAQIRSTRVGEALIINDSKLKNQATALSRSLEIANQQKTLFAEDMQRMAAQDPLTGLFNRRGLRDAFRQSSGTDQLGCLMLVDLDGFKSVNDAYGHESGDQILLEVARRLKDVATPGAILARIGGDEFAILFRHQTSKEDAEIIANQLVTVISAPFPKMDPGRVGASLGAYIGPLNRIDEAMSYADAALYAAKKQGRNRWRLFDDELQKQAELYRDIERDLAKALAHKTLEIHYQPIVADGGERADTFEALLRWHHAQHGWVAPPIIVDIASRTGLSEPLLRFIIHEACQMALLVKEVNAGAVRIAVNVSPRELAQLAVDELILSAFEEMALDPAVLELEITEDVAIDLKIVQRKLERLSKAGVRIAIDDFGTGYSSLGSLHQIRADRVKIDKMLVTGTTLASAHRSLIDAVLRVSEAYGFDVVAEGVETEDDLQTMRALGCPLMQGHLFAPAMAKDDAIQWLCQMRN